MSERLDAFYRRLLDKHAAEVGKGLHDGGCEYGPGFYLCHCSKRRREADGFTELPTIPLEFPPPDCPRCGRPLWYDGDGWECETCPLAWSSDGTGVHFTDDYGEISLCTVCDRRGCTMHPTGVAAS